MQANIERRFNILGAVVVLIVFSILVRLFEKQIIDHDHYVALAQSQHRYEKSQLAERGKIYVHDYIEDKDSLYPLSFDVRNYALMVIPNQVKDKVKTAKDISDILKMDEKEVFDKINNDKLYIPPLKHDIDFGTSELINSKNLEGVIVLPEYKRYYPEKSLASHLLGFVNAEGKGNYGFEGHYDKELQGTAGMIIGEKDTYGRLISLLSEKDPKDGTSYVLTLDRSVQYYVEKKLKEAIDQYQAESGTILIMDVKTGGILAMADYPSYDPNNFRDYAKDNAGIFINPAIAYLYEPGSIMKPIVMSGAIDSGVVTPDTKGTFSNMTIVSGYEIHTAEDKAFGEENMTQVLQNSDNVAMVWLSEKIGKENLYKIVSDFGLLDKTNIDLDSESAGSTAPLKEWRDIHRATVAFGQGISISPIEILSAYATLANSGVYIYPKMVDKIILPDGQEKKVEKREGKQVIKADTAKQMAEMLKSVVDNGHSKKAGVEGFNVSAKTGTAQIPKADGTGYEDNESKLGIYNHSLAGFAPTEDPRFVMLVKLTKPKTAKYAESTAAPLFGDIASFLINFYYRLPLNK